MGGPFRQPYGYGMGFENQFAAYGASLQTGAGNFTGLGTAGLMSIGTPDVTVGELFIANNTGAVNITYFNLQQYAYKSPQYSGKTIKVLVLDNGSTTFTNSSQLFLAGTDNLSTAGTGSPALYQFVFFNSSWYQTDFARPNRNQITTFTIGTASSININAVGLAFITGTATPVQVKSLSGGQVGQVVTLVGLGSSGISAYAMSGGNINIVGTNMYLIPNSGALQFIKINNNLWNMYEIGTSGGVQ